MTIGEIFKAMRSEFGITQSMLASSPNIGFSSVNRWENGASEPFNIVLAA